MPLALRAHHLKQHIQPMSHHSFRLCPALLLGHHRVHVRHQVGHADRRVRGGRIAALCRGFVGTDKAGQAGIETSEFFGRVDDEFLQPAVELG